MVPSHWNVFVALHCRWTSYRVVRSPLAISEEGVKLPDPGREAPGDLGMEIGKDKDLSGVQYCSVHTPKNSFSPGELIFVV